MSFLDITYDSRLTFRSHLNKICKKGRVGVNVLSGCDKGWNKNKIRNTYIALVCYVLLYGVSA